jgi:hypothetical protein
MAPSLRQAIEIAGEKAYVILDRSLLRKTRLPRAPIGTGPSTPQARDWALLLQPAAFSMQW